MTTYAIRNEIVQFFVIQTFAPDHFIEYGPYKNEESAKRRIRDLKRKDATAIVDKDRHNEMSRDDDCACGGGQISGHDTHCPEHDQPVAASWPVKLDDSGKMQINDPGWINPPFNPITRQVGCYPAIPKRAYQR